MAVEPISAGLGAASLISGKEANKKARKDAQSAQSGQKAIEQRMIKLWDVLFARAKKAEDTGEFDPEKRIAALESDTARYESRDLGNLTGAMRIAGYKPGDSEVRTRQDAVKIKYRSFLDNLRNQIRDKSWQDQQDAYLSVGGANLGAPLASMQNRATSSYGRIQNPSGFLGNLLGGLRPPRPRGFALGGGGSAFAGAL
jgi:hypothetical protein